MKSMHKWMLVVGMLGVSPLLLANDTASDAAAAPVLDTTPVLERQVPELQFLDGHIEAVNKSTLSAQTSGVIESLAYDVDDVVERGSVIAKIRSTNQKAGLQQAKAGVSEAEAGASQARASQGQAKAGLAEAKAGLQQAKAEEQRSKAAIQQGQAGYQQAQAGLQEAQALLKEAQSNFNRIRGIYEKRLIPRADYDRAEAALSTAKAKVESARAQAGSAQAQVQSAVAQAESAGSMVQAAVARVGSADAALAAASASVEASKAAHDSASAQVAQAGEALEYTTLVAPYSGIVTERHVQLGEAVSPGAPIMTGISLDQMRVIVEVPQRLIGRVRELKRAFVYLDGSNKYLPVEKMTIFPYANPKTNAFSVRIDLRKGLENLFPGMFVKVAFALGDDKALAIPKSAVAIRSEVTGVYVVDGNGRPSLRQVRLGREVDDGQVSVLAGLSEGEKIAVDPVHAVIVLKKQAAALATEGGSHE